MRTNVVLNDVLMHKAQQHTGLKTKKATIEAGLKLLVTLSQQAEIKKYRGKLKWQGDLHRMRMDS